MRSELVFQYSKKIEDLQCGSSDAILNFVWAVLVIETERLKRWDDQFIRPLKCENTCM